MKEDLSLNTKKVKLIGLLFICMTISAVVADQFIYADTVKRIALLPFKINATEDLSFLKEGIYDMFTTRLSSEGQVEAISRKKALK